MSGPGGLGQLLFRTVQGLDGGKHGSAVGSLRQGAAGLKKAERPCSQVERSFPGDKKSVPGSGREPISPRGHERGRDGRHQRLHSRPQLALSRGRCSLPRTPLPRRELACPTLVRLRFLDPPQRPQRPGAVHVGPGLAREAGDDIAEVIHRLLVLPEGCIRRGAALTRCRVIGPQPEDLRKTCDLVGYAERGKRLRLIMDRRAMRRETQPGS